MSSVPSVDPSGVGLVAVNPQPRTSNRYWRCHMAGDPSESVTSTLQAKWYNILISQLGLPSKSFQLLQPSTPLGNTSDQLWSYFNNLPPAAIDNYFSVSGGNRFFDDYQGVLSQLKSQSDDAFRRAIGDNYDAWMKYIVGVSPMPSPKQLPETFRSWAFIHAPDVAQAGATALANGLNDPIFIANMAAQNTSGFINNTPNWSKTIADLRGLIPQAEGRSIDFDSSTTSSDISNTWAKGSVEGFYDFFTGSAGGSYSALSAKVAGSKVTIKGGFQHVLTFGADPGSWYNSSALGAAYHTKDNTVWKHGTPSWDSTFGSKGNMLWFTSSLVVVDGIDMTIHSEAELSTEEQTEISANLSVGIWPFFSLGASGGYTHGVSYSSTGAATIHITNPAGNPVVLGGNVVPVAAYLTSGLKAHGGRTFFAADSSSASKAAFVVVIVLPQTRTDWDGREQGYVLTIAKSGPFNPATYVVRTAAGATIGAGNVVWGPQQVVVPRNTAFSVFNVGVHPFTVSHP